MLSQFFIKTKPVFISIKVKFHKNKNNFFYDVLTLKGHVLAGTNTVWEFQNLNKETGKPQ